MTQIAHLRSLEGDAYVRAKKKLPAFMVSAATETGGHASKDLGQHTGLLQIDIDKLADIQEAQQVKGQLAVDPHILACWISPGGKGVKGIVPISASHESHKACFEAAKAHFQETLGREIDASCCDASRLCFVSHDPGLTLKEAAEAFLPWEVGQAAEGGMPAPVYSAPSLHSPSYILHPPSSILHNTSWSDYPRLEAFYHTLVVRRIGEVQPGLRNAALVEIVPILYSAIAPRLIPLFAARFYELNSSKFHDPLDQHMKEAQALQAGIAASYQHERLTPQEAAIYRELDEREQTAFRICKALSCVEDERCPPPLFFLSSESLGIRLGILNPQADRVLKRLCKLGVIEMTVKGVRRTKGAISVASRYRWMLPTRQIVEAYSCG